MYATGMDVRHRPLSYESDWPYVLEHLTLKRKEGATGIVSFDRHTGRQLAVLIAEDWTDNSADVHIIVSSPIALRHKFLQECFWYIFSHCDRVRMYGQIRSDNPKALRFVKRLGFTEAARLTDAYEDGVDNVIMELHRDNCSMWEPERSVSNG